MTLRAKRPGTLKYGVPPLRKMEPTQHQCLARNCPGKYSRAISCNSLSVNNLHSTGKPCTPRNGHCTIVIIPFSQTTSSHPLTPLPFRICGKSSLHCFLHADAARISVKMADFQDASVTGSICIALLPQMRQTVKCSRKRLQAATKLFMKSVAFTRSILYLCKCSFNTC